MLTYLGVLAVFISSVNALTGDLDLDGDVDFADFFLLADNFGKKGAIADNCGNEIALPNETGELVGTVDGLAYIRINYVQAVSWDADAEDDGIRVIFTLIDSQGNRITSRDIDDGVVVKLNLRIFTSKGYLSYEKLSETPFYDRDFIVRGEDITNAIRLPFEEYVSKIPSTRYVTNTGSVTTIVELRLIQSDATVFAAQTQDAMEVE